MKDYFDWPVAQKKTISLESSMRSAYSSDELSGNYLYVPLRFIYLPYKSHAAI